MTSQQAAEFLEEHDLRVLVLPDQSGYAVFRLSEFSIRDQGYEQAVESLVGRGAELFILPGGSGFAVLGPKLLSVLRAIAYGETFESAIENAWTAAGIRAL